MAGNYLDTINDRFDAIDNIHVAKLYLYIIRCEILKPNTENKFIPWRSEWYSLLKLNKNNGDDLEILSSIDNNESNIYTAVAKTLTVFNCSNLKQIKTFRLKSGYIESKRFYHHRLIEMNACDNMLVTLFSECDYELLVYSLDGVLMQNLIPRAKELRAFCIDSSSSTSIILGYFKTDITIYSSDGTALHSISKHI